MNNLRSRTTSWGTIPTFSGVKICSDVELRCEVIEVVSHTVFTESAVRLGGIVLSLFAVDYGLVRRQRE